MSFCKLLNQAWRPMLLAGLTVGLVMVYQSYDALAESLGLASPDGKGSTSPMDMLMTIIASILTTTLTLWLTQKYEKKKAKTLSIDEKRKQLAQLSGHEINLLNESLPMYAWKSSEKISRLASLARKPYGDPNGSKKSLIHNKKEWKELIYVLLAPASISYGIKEPSEWSDVPEIQFRYLLGRCLTDIWTHKFANMLEQEDGNVRGYLGNNDPKTKTIEEFRMTDRQHMDYPEQLARVLVRDQNTGEKLWSEQQFVEELTSAGGKEKFREPLKEFSRVFEGFHPNDKPMLWRILLTQWLIGYALNRISISKPELDADFNLWSKSIFEVFEPGKITKIDLENLCWYDQRKQESGNNEFDQALAACHKCLKDQYFENLKSTGLVSRKLTFWSNVVSKFNRGKGIV